METLEVVLTMSQIPKEVQKKNLNMPGTYINLKEELQDTKLIIRIIILSNLEIYEKKIKRILSKIFLDLCHRKKEIFKKICFNFSTKSTQIMELDFHKQFESQLI